MVRWTDIKSEYQKLETGFRERIVRLFETYQGQPTDEVVRGKPVLVTVNSFSRHVGLSQRTFQNWVSQYGLAKPCVNENVPPRESFLLQAKKLIEEVIPYLPHLSSETYELIREDIAALRLVLDQIEASLEVKS